MSNVDEDRTRHTPGRRPTPVWLLDIDGVVNALAGTTVDAAWPTFQWLRTTASVDGRRLPILAARPVLSFIRDVHEQGLADIRWHTTWGHGAVDVLAPLVGLPRFAVQPPSVASSPSTSRRSAGKWWKIQAAEHLVASEGRRLLWTDDDLDRHRQPDGELSPLLRESGDILLISPASRLGLIPIDLQRIRGFVT